MELISREEKIRDASREGIGKIIYMRAKRLVKLTNLDKYYYIYIKSKGFYQTENLMSNGSSRYIYI